MGIPILFPLAHRHQQPEVLPGSSHFSSLPAVFAVHLTGRYQTGEATVYQTDRQGLGKLAMAARGAAEEINDTIAAVGRLGAYSQLEELGKDGQETLMWTLVRLSELRQAIDRAAGDFESALQRGHYLSVNLATHQGATETSGEANE
ncbi:MAG: hypothetical protein EHM62_05800 [Methylococcus sp.]|nr:MAG: hypothetical protein EHM62_05800 [Methylococcus sp.]